MIEVTASKTKRNRRYMVFNRTDGVFAAADLLSLRAARELVRCFRHRYAAQGYYLTAWGERVPADSVELEIIDMDFEPPLFPEPEPWRWSE